MIESAIPTLVLIGLAAVLAPIVAEWSRRFIAVPEVVIQIIFGILLGPFVLNLAHPNNIVTALSDFGLTYLMFLAGTELDLSTMRQGHLGRAAGSWGVSLVLALAVGVVLHATGLVLDHVVVALCLTTTALGTLLPDPARRGGAAHAGRALHPVGGRHRRVRPDRGGGGPAHEPRPTADLPPPGPLRRRGRDRRPPGHQVHPPRFIALMRKHLHSTAQLPVRISVLLVILLVYLAEKLSLDVLLGAFAAGVVVRLFIKGEDSEPITSKLEAIGFGFLIPIFFIESGIKFDLHALIHMPKVLLLVPMFTVIFLFTRGLPTWVFFRGVVTKVEARALAVLSATGLPIIVVITTLGVSEHRMKPQNAAALVAAGMLSVLVYPLIGLRWLDKGSKAAGAPAVPEPSDGQ